jgi:hypothetical protein
MDMSFRFRIRPFVDAELKSAEQMRLAGDHRAEFRHLERAHVLGQASTVEHVRIHALMFLWALRQRQPRELVGQLFRIIGAATKTTLGLFPRGNTGGSNVSPFKRMEIPTDLSRILDSVR